MDIIRLVERLGSTKIPRLELLYGLSSSKFLGRLIDCSPSGIGASNPIRVG